MALVQFDIVRNNQASSRCPFVRRANRLKPKRLGRLYLPEVATIDGLAEFVVEHPAKGVRHRDSRTCSTASRREINNGFDEVVGHERSNRVMDQNQLGSIRNGVKRPANGLLTRVATRNDLKGTIPKKRSEHFGGSTNLPGVRGNHHALEPSHRQERFNRPNQDRDAPQQSKLLRLSTETTAASCGWNDEMKRHGRIKSEALRPQTRTTDTSS